MINGPNLARDPFLNRRPLRRVVMLLWLAGAGLLAVNGWRYWDHFSGRGEQRQELGELEALVAEERQLLSAAEDVLDSYDLDWQRRQVDFLNARIAERTFAWSALFDDVAEVLPRNVRIERITPQLAGSSSRRRGSAARSSEDEVALEFAGAAEEADALLVLVDAFYAHERFRRPNLKVESRDGAARQVRFSMDVIYRPVKPARKAAAEEDAPEPEGPDAVPDGEPDGVTSPEVET